MRILLGLAIVILLCSTPAAAVPIKLYTIDQQHLECPSPHCYGQAGENWRFGQQFTPTLAGADFVAVWVSGLSTSMQLDLYKGAEPLFGIWLGVDYAFFPGSTSGKAKRLLFEFPATVPLVPSDRYNFTVQPIISAASPHTTYRSPGTYGGGTGFSYNPVDEIVAFWGYDLIFAEGTTQILDLDILSSEELLTLVPGCSWCAQFVNAPAPEVREPELEVQEVPEPASVTFLGSGLALAGALRRRRLSKVGD